MTKRAIEFAMYVAHMTADTSARTISGTITMFDVASSDGRTIHAGSITPRMPLNRVKLLIDHDQRQPVGYMTSLNSSATQADATFYVPEGPAGDQALADASNGLRDGLSVGLMAAPDGYYFDDEYNFHVTAAEMFETSLCAIPAFQDAQVTNVAAALADAKKGDSTMTKEQIAAAVLAGTMTAAQAAALTALAVTDAAPAAPAAPAAAVPAELAAGPAATPAPAAPIFTMPRVQSLHQVATTVAAAIATGRAIDVLAALQDVIPTDDAGQGYIGREDWLGQLWAATKTGRPWIDSFGVPRQLTSMKIKGWQWLVRPTVAKYSGNKTEVHSNKPKTKAVESDAERWAGGWDIDRIFVDLGDPAFLTDFWTAALMEYQTSSDFDIAQQIVAAATATVAEDATILGAVAGAASDLRRIGASLDYLKLSEDLFEEYAALKIADLPAWLANAVGGVSLINGTAAVGDLNVMADEALDLGTLVAYDSRAATVSEKAPIQVQALDVAKGGLDLGFYSYGGVTINDPRAIRLRTVTRP